MDKRQKHFDLVRRVGCICCLQVGVYNDQTDMHHIVDKGYRRLSGGDYSVLPLCKWHHVGQIPEGYTRDDMMAMLGPSLALQKKAFIQAYGTERQLLAEVQKLMEKL